MANVQAQDSKFLINGQNAYIIGNASKDFIGTYVVMLVNTGSFVGSITVKSRIFTPAASADAVTPVAVCYQARSLNGSIGTDATVSTAITTTSLILIPASGQNIVLDCTAYTSGTMTVYCTPLLGAAA